MRKPKGGGIPFSYWLGLGLFLANWGIEGPEGQSWAAQGSGPLTIEQARVSGTVSQVPLRVVLDQLQEQLGIAYTAAPEDLAKPVSVVLHQVSVPQALEKLLATWDYALQRDHTGRIRQLFVVKKNPVGEAEKQGIQATNESSQAKSVRRSRKREGVSLEQHYVTQREDSSSTPVVSDAEHSDFSPQLPHHPDERSWTASAEIERNIISTPIWEQQVVLRDLEAARGEILLNEMEILPTPEWEQQAIIQELEFYPPETFDPERDILPTPEWEQQAILQALASTP